MTQTSPSQVGISTMILLPDAASPRKADSAVLPLLRKEDLKRLGIVNTWTSLNKWIDERGFPPGQIIGRFRTWTTAEVMAWIERSQPRRPSGAALPPPRWGRRMNSGNTKRKRNDCLQRQNGARSKVSTRR